MKRLYKVIMQCVLLQKQLQMYRKNIVTALSRYFSKYGSCKNISTSYLRSIVFNSHEYSDQVAQKTWRPNISKITAQLHSTSQCASLGSTTTGFSHPCFLQFSANLTCNFSSSRHFSTHPPSAAVADISASSVEIVAVNNVPRDLLFPDFFPIYGAEAVIEYLHKLTGLPWWSTIVLTAFLLRIVLMVPLTIHTFHNAAKLERLQPEIKEMAERLKKEVILAKHEFGWDKKQATQEYNKNLKRLLAQLYVRDNCHPMKSVAVFWVQTPIWLSVSYALRNMAVKALNPDMDGHTECQSLMEEGTAWFPDLSCTDSTWLLPLLVGTANLLNIEMNYLNVPEVTKYRKRLTVALRGSVLIFVYISSAVPSVMALYWGSSATMTFIQNILFDYSLFRRLVGLPQSRTESSSPIQALVQKGKTRYFNR